jgi:hypothetical protein
MAKREDKFPLTELDYDQIQRTAQMLRQAFNWSDSMEGYKHWQKIHDRLMSLAVKTAIHQGKAGKVSVDNASGL